MAKSWLKLRIKWNFELTVFELAVPDLYIEANTREFNMEMRFSFVFVAFTLWNCTPSLTVTVSGEISSYEKILYRAFPVPPSKRAEISFQIFYNYKEEPTFKIYTTEYHEEWENKCIRYGYDQVGNKNLYQTLTTDWKQLGLRCVRLESYPHNRWENRNTRLHTEDIFLFTRSFL